MCGGGRDKERWRLDKGMSLERVTFHSSAAYCLYLLLPLVEMSSGIKAPLVYPLCYEKKVSGCGVTYSSTSNTSACELLHVARSSRGPEGSIAVRLNP